MNHSPPNDETPRVQGKGFQETNQKTDNAIVAPAEKIGNTAYLIARLALLGHTVRRGTNDDYFVGKWGVSRHCPDFNALQVFAKTVGIK